MKLNHKNPLFAVLVLALATHSAQAFTYYWDGNNGTANFGSLTSATWGAPTVGTATAGWTTDATGATAISGNSITTGIGDDVNFGTGTVSRGLGGSALTVAAGGVNVRSITWGSQTTNNQTISGGAINIGTGSTISVGAGGTTVMTIASNLTGSSGFAKTGNVLALSGTNSGLTGAVNVTTGSLIFRNVAAKTGGTMVFSSGTTLGLGVGNTGFFSATDVTNAFAGTIAGNLTNITLNAATNISLDTSAGNFIYGGSIASSPARGLTKDGGSILTLTGANTYTGTTLVRGGTLRLENASAISGSTLVQISTNALQLGINGSFSNASTTLQGSTGTITLDRATSGSGAGQTHVFGGLILNGNALNFAAGSNVTSGTTPTIQFGTVQVPGGSGTNGGMNPTGVNMIVTGNFDSGATATGTATYTLSGTSTGNLISGDISIGAARTTANLAKTSTSTWTLSGTNIYNGTTTITGGKLAISSTGTINGTSAVTIGAGEFNYNSATALIPGVSFTTTGGRLSGTGTITPSVTITSGNTLAPGNSIGTMSFGTGLILAGTYSVELGTVNVSPASSLSDRAVVTGALSVGGNLTLVNNAGADGNGSAAAGAYRIATSTGATTGTFASITNPLSATLHEKVVYGSNTVDLNLYRLATGSTANTNLGKARVGDTLTGNLTTTNSATADGFSENLNASVGSNAGDVNSSSGTVSGVIAGASASTITVGLSTATSGAKSGSVLVSSVSDGAGTSGYSTTANGSQTVGVTGNVYDLASANFAQTAGVAISGSGPSYTLDFGSGLALSTLYTASFSIQNGVVVNSFIDTLSGGYGLTGSSAFGTSAANFSTLAAGAAADLFNITFFTNSVGSYSGTFTFDGASVQSGLSDVSVGDFTVALSASAIPEPNAAALLGGLGVLALLRRRRN